MKKQLFGFLLCLALVLSLLPAAVQATGGIPAVPLSSMQHTHTPSDWQGDQQSHYKVCTGCLCTVIPVSHPLAVAPAVRAEQSNLLAAQLAFNC